MEKILVIENRKNESVGIGVAIEKAGYEVAQANTPIDALNILREVDPQLIIMINNQPPDEMGDSFFRLRCASEAPILVIGDREDAAAMLENGADAYLDKPPSLIELIARVHSILRRQKNMAYFQEYGGAG